MQKTEYCRRINKSSLIITPEKDCQSEKDSIEMFRYNHIPCFLKMEAHRKDADLQFCYDITSRRSLDQILEYKSLGCAMLKIILNSFDQACIQAEDFMITENDILLEPEYIFADHNIEQIVYCYLPGNQKDICMQFKKLMEYLLQHLDHKDEQAVQLAYGVYQRVVEERTALHNVLNVEKQFTNIQIPFKQILNRNSQMSDQRILDSDSQRQDQQILSKDRQVPDQQALHENRQMPDQQIFDKDEQETNHNKWIPAVENSWSDLNPSEQKQFKPDVAKTPLIQAEQQIQNIVKTPFFQVEQQMNEASTKNKMKKTEKQQENVLSQKTDPVIKIHQKETLRKQAAEKLKNMLRKKIYTDKNRYTEEYTVFEADEEEVVYSSPTVCLVPEMDEIQNQFVYQGADRSRDFNCPQGKLLLGSDMEESDIYIPFPMVSRIHARIENDAQGTFLEDLNSTNGTHVNGELLQYREKRMLKKGDIISFAGECYSFH